MLQEILLALSLYLDMRIQAEQPAEPLSIILIDKCVEMTVQASESK
jgi:hypothetical protein